MKSFFALATAFALAIVPAIVANPVPADLVPENVVPVGRPMRFASPLPGGLVLGVKSFAANAELVVDHPGPGNTKDTTAFVLSAGTGTTGRIEVFGASGGALCVSARAGLNEIATVAPCSTNDPQQQWFVSSFTNPVTISSENLCLSAANVRPQASNPVFLRTCNSTAMEQRWNAVAV